MKVLHVLNSNKYSGAENVACQIIRLSCQSGVDAIYCSPDGPIREALSERGITFAPVRSLSVSEIRRVVKEYRPDVLHAHDMRASCVCALAKGKARVVSLIHNNAFDSRKLSLKSLAFLACSPSLRHIFWVSESAQKGYLFQKQIKKKCSVLHNVIDVQEARRKVAADCNTYVYDAVFVGRLEAEKDPERLLRILSGIHKRLPLAKFAIVGSGSMQESLRLLADSLGIGEAVCFLGFQPNPLKIVSCSKLMLLSSRFEGLPMCALEAQALGVPIVSTPTDGLKEIIRDGENGFLSEDDEQLIDKSFQLITDSSLREKMSRASLVFSDKFNDLTTYADRIFEAYRKS